MDFLPTIEDPRHTPGKRHGYAKEQLSPHALTNNNQKSLLNSFITTPPVSKPPNHFISNTNKFYLTKQQNQERNSYTSSYPIRKSAFLVYSNSSNQKAPEMQIDPPTIIGNPLITRNDILKPKPRYATSVSQVYNKDSIKLGSAQYSDNSNSTGKQIIGVDLVTNRQEGLQQQSMQMACFELKSREVPIISEKKMDDMPRLKNFKNILNKFQIASDYALRQKQQREQNRYNSSDDRSDQEFNSSDWEQSSEHAYSEQNYKLAKNKQRHLRPFTVSAGKNIRSSLPKQWLTRVNDTYVNVERRSAAMSGMSSVPPSPPMSSHKPRNRTNSLRIISMKQRGFFNNNSYRNEQMTCQLHNVNDPRPITENETRISPAGTPSSSSHGCIIQCISTDSYKRVIPVAQMSSPSPSLPPSKSQSISSETEDDDDSASVIGLYKQAEPSLFIHSNPIKSDLTVGNIWNPPILVEIRAKQDEEKRILRHILGYRNSQKYRFLIIPRYNLLTFKSFAANHQNDVSEEYELKICFILLQLIYALKSFQLNGIEAINDDLSEFILLCRYTRINQKIGNMDHLPRVLLLQECAKALQQDKSSSLTEAKNALELGIFVGHDASSFNDEEDAQAWIDSKRADFVNYLFREVADGSCLVNEVYEQLRLQFLLSITPQTLLKMVGNMYL
uniref:Bm7393 n=1 Tax=Brugia malayi TaxID=6279 RepID=A0A1I9GDI6_BRUMA|nr:Bm7393 [Brugia malayi]